MLIFLRLSLLNALAAVAESITVIAPFHDVQEPARRARVGVVVHREEASKCVEGKMEGIPEAGDDALESAERRSRRRDQAF
jgi:hypothetical protein